MDNKFGYLNFFSYICNRNNKLKKIIMELKSNQVVKLRNGKFGAVASFNGKPFQIVFTSFTTPTKRYDENFNNKNHEYDIVEIFDGSSIEVASVFKASFNADGLNSIWKRVE